MRHNRRAGILHSQRGVAAVEMAILMAVFAGLLLALPLFVGRCLWHYSVVNKAAHDAARYLAAVPLVDRQNPIRAAAAVKIAEYIAAKETAELNPGGMYPVSVTINCLPVFSCSLGEWDTVKVNVGVKMFDPFLPQITENLLPAAGDGLLLRSEVEIQHAGK